MHVWPLILVLALQGVTSLEIDDAMTKRVEEVIHDDTFVLGMHDIKPRQRKRGNIEPLFNLEFPGSQQRLAIKLDRRANTVLVDTVVDGVARSVHFPPVQGLGDKTHSLAVIFHQAQPGAHVSLFVDCEAHGSVATPRTLRQMFKHTAPQRLRVLRDRRYKMNIGAELEDVVDCDVLPPIEQISSEPEIEQAQQPLPVPAGNDIYTYRRGDIPLIHEIEEKESLLIKTMVELIAAVKSLREEVEQNRGETRNLRDVLENCQMCREPPPPRRPSCSDNPCFPGAQCHDTEQGPRCGSCPRGYVGDGRNCKPGVTCAERPCFQGVRCFDTVEGFQCGPCPASHTGDGRTCKHRGGCEQTPCYPGVQCINTEDAPYYRCGSCLPGYTGNGTICHDIDEARWRFWRRF